MPVEEQEEEDLRRLLARLPEAEERPRVAAAPGCWLPSPTALRGHPTGDAGARALWNAVRTIGRPPMR